MTDDPRSTSLYSIARGMSINEALLVMASGHRNPTEFCVYVAAQDLLAEAGQSVITRYVQAGETNSA